MFDLPHDAHAVLEANAGTGKTQVMAQIFVDLLVSTSCRLEQILAVTFTERATVELRRRVRRALEETRIRNKTPNSRTDKIEAALLSFGSASICTIHSFCHQLLVEFSPDFAAGQSFEVIDSRQAFHRAFRSFLREYPTAKGHVGLVLEQWLKRHTIDDLEALLFTAHDLRYLEAGAVENHCASLTAMMELANLQAVRDDYATAALASEARRAALKALDLLAQLIEENRGDLDGFAQNLASFDFSPLLKPRRVSADGKKRFPEGFSPEGKVFLSVAKRAHAAIQIEPRAIDAFLPQVTERLESQKLQQGLLDYDDMLRRTWRLLNEPNAEQILPILRARLRYGLIDEFQDTDDLQWKILRRLFVESKGGNQLYLIGDPKQAIYAFRGADVFTYLAAVDDLIAGGAPRLSLNENFRSTPTMVEALNAILDQQATDPLFTGEITYRTPSRSARPDFRVVSQDGKPLEPITLMRYAPADLDDATAANARRALGRRFAENLRRLLFDQRYQMKIVQKDGVWETVGPDDVMILTRSEDEGIEAGSYLREVGVPFSFYKLEGLFQSDEAWEILDLLKAIEQPSLRARRIKAYLTPFFGLELNELAPSGAEPEQAYEMLLEWNALAEQERLSELFDQVLHQSGLVARQLLLHGSRRRLSNYEHIFETLLEHAHAKRQELSDLIILLQGYIAGGAASLQREQNFLRPESAGPAVRILTVHKSKGLEAKVVVLFGGLYSPIRNTLIARYHDEGHQSHLAVGKEAKDIVKDVLRKEAAEEDQRLLYVAITRAAAKLFLPFFPDGALKKPLSGYYAALNRRLNAMASAAELREDLFAVEDVNDGEASRPPERAAAQPRSAVMATTTGKTRGPSRKEGAQPAPERSTSQMRAGATTGADPAGGEVIEGEHDPSAQPSRWFPPEKLLNEDDYRDAALNRLLNLKARHAPLVLRSYTSLQRHLEADTRSPAFDSGQEAARRGDARDGALELEGSREAGIFLHEAIEELDLRSLAEPSDFDSWKNRADVRGTFERAMRRRRGLDEASIESAMELVHRALHWSFRCDGGRSSSDLYSLAAMREMEFLYPIARRVAGSSPSGTGASEQSTQPLYFRGFIDLVFEHQGLTYLADWKSDVLPSYEPAALKTHVERNYQLQMKIYLLAITRLLRIGSAADYEKRFGGLLYLFLRGLSGTSNDSAKGVYFCRPAWEELERYESELSSVE